MKIAEARAWLTARSSRVRTKGGQIVIGIPLDIAEEIAALLPPEKWVILDPTVSPDVWPNAPKPERVIDTESGPVEVPKKKVVKKKKWRKG